MIYCEQNRKRYKRNICQHNTAEQEYCRRDYGERQCFQFAIFIPTNNPEYEMLIQARKHESRLIKNIVKTETAPTALQSAPCILLFR